MATRPASENPFPELLVNEVAAPAAAPSGKVRLYAKSDGLLYWKDDAGTEYPIDSGTGVADILDLSTAETDDTLVLAPDGLGGVEFRAETGGGGGGADDPIADVFGTPTTAYEFDAALSGWTNLGSATAQDANATVPDHYYVNKAATSSVALTGIYRASPSMPFTVITKVSDIDPHADNYCRAGSLFVGEASPGKICSIELVHNNDWYVSHDEYTNGTTFGSTVGTDHLLKAFAVPLYLGIVANSSTDIDLWYSFGGRIWRKRTDARNPSFTVGSFGIFVDPESATFGIAAAFDFVRLWNSAKTFPGN